MERLPPKIHTSPEGTPCMAAEDRQQGSRCLDAKLKEQLEAKNFAEAEKTADSILELMGVSPGCRPEW